jgi:hypothetical protein
VIVRFPFDEVPATLWRLRRDGRRVSCVVAFVPNGVEARVTQNGRCQYSRTFSSGDDALEWAEEERVDFLLKGWADRPTREPFAYTEECRPS